MSHFSLLVIGPTTDEELTAALQPYHEFECTGADDQYVQDLDITDEIKKDFEESKTFKGSFVEYVREYHQITVLLFGENSKSDSCRYGYATSSKDGEIEKIVRRTNPNKKWDWWTVGGRFSNKLLLKNGESVNSCKLLGLDLKSMRSSREENAAKEWDSVWAHLSGNEAPKLWKHVREEMFKGELDKAKEFYNSQPMVKAFNRAVKALGMHPFEELERFLMDKDQFVKKAGDDAFSAFAVLRDGKWHENGKMGWFGCVSNEKMDWQKEFNSILETVSPEEMLTLVDCHI